MIRSIVPDDIPWGMSLAHRRYPSFDPGGALIALGQAMRLKTALAWRTDHAFLIANCVSTTWFPKHVTLHVLWLCTEEGHHWEAVELLRESAKWAKRQGCAKWLFNSNTDHAIGPLARRIGARLAECYMIDFEGGDL